jgi:hypothetical protein
MSTFDVVLLLLAGAFLLTRDFFSIAIVVVLRSLIFAALRLFLVQVKCQTFFDQSAPWRTQKKAATAMAAVVAFLLVPQGSYLDPRVNPN